ncbi:MAG TPA: alginate lyase family protein [Rhodocyclaceae bacterium]|nr:alginate lyase family protein [Rhodocyclaceae bacterium]
MSKLTRVGWYWNRLRCMSVAEMVERASTSAGHALERRRRPVPIPPPDLTRRGACWLPAHELPPVPPAVIDRADEILGGRWRIFARGPVALGLPPEWNRNPHNGAVLPMAFGKTMAFRDTTVIGDIKYLWEPNRHLELVVLAQAWKATGLRKYLDALGTLLTSWFRQCPYPLGPNWSSALEAGIRLINWSIVWQLIGGFESPLFAPPEGVVLLRDWLDSIWRHAEFIRGHRSLHSSANNHLIGELSGLYVASVTWPCWEDAPRWREAARAGLETEVLRQNAPDGVNLEQATSYQQFVWDFLLFAGLAARATGDDFSTAYWQRMEAMLDYVAAIMDTGGQVPQFGDADDGLACGLSLCADRDPFRSQLATGAVLFKRSAFARKAGRFDLRSVWLLGRAAADDFATLLVDRSELLTPRQAFPDGGVYVLGSALDTPREVRVVADAGPLGLGGIAAHGHADALSFTLSMDGREFLVDPGTGTYHGPRAWRDGFRSTALHNTLTVDGEDQAITGGKFMWIRKYEVSVLEWSSSADADRLVAEHDGYRRLAGHPVHRRAWRLDKRSGTLSVRDELGAPAPRAVALNWHFAENCVITCTPDGLVVGHDGVTLLVTLPPGGETTVICGSDVPLCGWVSRGYDLRRASTTVIWRGHLGPGQAAETVFRRG